MSEDMKVALPVDEDNSIEEASAQMPVGTEDDSVASVDKAANVTKKATAPKTKAGILNAMYGKLSGMKKDQLNAMYREKMNHITARACTAS